MTWRAVSCLWVITGLLGASTQAQDQDQESRLLYLQLMPEGLEDLSPEQVEKVEDFLAEAEQNLPELFVLGLPKISKLKVSFKADPNGQELLLPSPCRLPEKSPEQSGGKVELRQTLGMEHGDGRISLNRLLIEEILKGPENSTSFPCGHGNYYRAALGVVIHEMAHFYDRIYRVSSDPHFLDLNGWVKTGLILRWREQGNALIDSYNSRSPDIYEYSHPREAFAVNMEFFLLDPEYACRRPALHHYLVKHFEQDPLAARRKCQVNTEIKAYSNSGGQVPLANLDPSRIYQVHYLFASAGDQIMSLFGHAMFRLIICPEGVQPGPPCLSNIEEHIVLSYRANIRDLITSYLKGLFGGYPSQLFMYPFLEIQNEYTKDEFRDLISLPIRFSKDPLEDEERKRLFIYQTLTHNWEYQGHYYFLSNNCSVEALNLLRTAIPDGKVQKTKGKTPKSLYKKLEMGAYIDDSVLEDKVKAINEGYFFPSRRDIYEAAFKRIKGTFPDWPYKDFEEMMLAKAEERYFHYLRRILAPVLSAKELEMTFIMLTHEDDEVRRDFEKNQLPKLLEKGSSNEALVETSGSLWVLESFSERGYNNRVLDGVAATLMGDQQEDPRLKKAFEMVLELQELRATSDPWHATSSGYGIPLKVELAEDLPEIEEKMSSRLEKEKEIKALIDKVFAPVVEERDRISSNKLFFLKERRRHSKASSVK